MVTHTVEPRVSNWNFLKPPPPLVFPWHGDDWVEIVTQQATSPRFSSALLIESLLTPSIAV